MMFVDRVSTMPRKVKQRIVEMSVLHRGLSVAALAVVLCACAASPESIKAANYNSSPYAYLTCPQLAQYKAMLNGRLVQASSEQDNARLEDVVGNLTLGIPVGSASHKWTPWRIADLKGRIVAVERVETADSCARQREASATN
jgi:starvation-inducible outer membrane lipoprotein